MSRVSLAVSLSALLLVACGGGQNPRDLTNEGAGVQSGSSEDTVETPEPLGEAKNQDITVKGERKGAQDD